MYLLDNTIKTETRYRMRVCEMNSTVSGLGLKKIYCEHGNET
jgi:hypothetical protein